ncbi:MAG: LacI family DNA-binding transcriptional regulator, partial [Ruminococcaceae bacterium]|nr:LacI family DNA-binding transcriptional regulator [Oscillospiraceae bacterium]
MNQNKRITVKDLARICGVSIGTVDRALNGRARINPETKKKILDAAEEYGYIKNEFAHT